MARPKKVIDPETVEKLASMGLSAELIAAVLDVDHRTVERRFAPILKKGRQARDGKLLAKLYQEAMGGNTAALIFACKAFCGLSERPEIVVNVQQNAVTAGIPESRLAEYRRYVMEFAQSEGAAKQPGQLPASQGEVAG
jgi:hypothetical protein